MVSCCNHRNHDKTCKRNDGKIFKLPRKFTKKQCKQPKRYRPFKQQKHIQESTKPLKQYKQSKPIQ